MMYEDLDNELEELKNNESYIKDLCEKINLEKCEISKDIYKALYKFTKINKLKYAYSWVIYNLGIVSRISGDILAAIDLHEEAFSIFTEENNVNESLVVITALIADYGIQQNFDRAIEYGLLGAEIAESVNNYERICAIKSNIANLYIEMDEFNKAKEMIYEVKKLPYMGNKANEAGCLINLAICESRTNNLPKAIEHIEKAYKIAEKFMENIIPAVLISMGHIYAESGLYEKAEEVFEESMNRSEKLGDNYTISDTLINWAELYLKKGEFQYAIDKLKEAESRSENLSMINMLKSIYFNLNKAYKGLKDYEKAYYYIEKYMEMEKQISTMKSSVSMKKLDKKKAEDETNTYKLLYNQTQVLYGVGQKITSNLRKEDIYNIIAQEMEKLMKLDVIHIAIYNDEDGIIEHQLSLNQGKKTYISPISIDEDTLSGHAIRYKQDIFINDFKKEACKYFKDIEKYKEKSLLYTKGKIDNIPESMIFVPILVEDKVIGVISAQSYNKNAYSLKDLTTLKILSTYMGIALENSRLYKEVQYFAQYDGLTNVLNRREFLKRGYKAYKQAQKESSNRHVAMIDIDNFKKINDTYGHQIGDLVLQSVADTIKSSIRSSDIVGRYGGEEFIAIINAKNSTHKKVAERIRKNIEEISVKSQKSGPIKVTASIGITYLNTVDKSLEDIIGISDKALYEAKNTGKNKVVIY